MAKPLITKDKARCLSLQAIENKANGVPCSGSRETVKGVWVNDPTAPGCERIREVMATVDETGNETGDYSYDVEADYDLSEKLTGPEKAAWAQARSEAVATLPLGPPEWAPAKGLER